MKQLKGKKIAGSSPGGSATLLANQALKQIGLEPGKDVSVLQMSGNAASRYAVLESGVVDASLLSVPENIIAHEKGYNELLFLGDIVEFPQNGFGTSDKRIRENPDEVYRMVRATLRGLQFIWDKNNQEAVTNILMKQWKVSDRKMAAEMARQVSRVLTKDAYVKPESVQVLVDLGARKRQGDQAGQRDGRRRLQFFGQSQERIGNGEIIVGARHAVPSFYKPRSADPIITLIESCPLAVS